MGLLEGKKAIITGGGSGIGKAITQQFLDEGCSVLVVGRDEKKLIATCNEFSDMGKVSYRCFDVTDFENMRSFFNDSWELLEGIDILVNNAGVLTQRDFKWHYLDLTPEEFDFTMTTNCKGTYFMCQNMIKLLLEKERGGHILNIASEMGVRPACVSYGISKHAVVAMTQGLGMKVASKGIVVNGIAPGATATEMMNWHEGDSYSYELTKNKRLGYPSEIGKLAAFLSSNYGDNIVGEVVICDGGSHLY